LWQGFVKTGVRGRVPVVNDRPVTDRAVCRFLDYADAGMLIEAVCLGLAMIDEYVGDGHIRVEVDLVESIIQQLLDLERTGPVSIDIERSEIGHIGD
jgi:hypothetical protein